MVPAELTNSDKGKPSSVGLANRRFGQAPHCTMMPRPAVASWASVIPVGVCMPGSKSASQWRRYGADGQLLCTSQVRL